MRRRLRCYPALLASAWLALTPGPLAAAPLVQEVFEAPQGAVDALVAAARVDDPDALQAVLGPGSERLLFSGDPHLDAEQRRRFVAAYDRKSALVPQGPGRMTLDVGRDDWPLPIPIVQGDGGWRFDARAGVHEIIDRRVGRNELSAIRVALACVAAQRRYFAWREHATGTGVYAQYLASRQGRHDGLYWQAAAGQPVSPLGPPIAAAAAYPCELLHGRPVPYQGYYFRVLTAQGPDAPEGARSYLRHGRMTGGFALIAWPATYGGSGIMTFEVNQDGVVFQKDLGPHTSRLASATSRFNPDLTWARISLSGP